MKNIILSMSLMLGSVSVWAQSLNDFLKMTDEKKMAFLESQATEIDDHIELIKFKNEHELFIQQLKKVGLRLEDIWGDTVLEGPYAQTEGPEVSLTSIYKVNGIVYAVSAIVSAAGVFTESDGCEYDENTESWSSECPEVTIYENFYVDIQGKFIESENYAEVD